MKKVYIETANTHIKRAYGLMDRKSLGKNQGMLFVFTRAQPLSFWMQNTYVPLDIAFIHNGKIEQIETMNALSTRSVSSNNHCRYALEVNQGWFKEHGIKVGTRILGEGMTHKNGNIVTAQGFWSKLFNRFVPNEKADKLDTSPLLPDVVEDNNNEEEQQNNQVDQMEPPDLNQQQVEPNNNTLYMEPQQEGIEPAENVDTTLSVRATIEQAEERRLSMEIMYWTLHGHVLPPRRMGPIQNDGYLVKSGPNGDYLVAYDSSPTIEGGGWTIQGGTPKNFLIDNIVSLQVVEENNSVN